MSFSTPSRHREQPTLALAPMLDVLFLLLVFFVTVSAFRDRERLIEVDLPSAETSTQSSSVTPIVITVESNGTLRLDETPHDMTSLRSSLNQWKETFGSEQVLIRGDREASYGLVIEVTDMVRSLGFRTIKHATVRKEG